MVNYGMTLEMLSSLKGSMVDVGGRPCVSGMMGPVVFPSPARTLMAPFGCEEERFLTKSS